MTMETKPMIGPNEIRALREQTGAGVMDCKRALEASGGDVDAAVAFLREKGLATARKKAQPRRSRRGDRQLHSSWVAPGRVAGAELRDRFRGADR